MSNKKDSKSIVVSERLHGWLVYLKKDETFESLIEAMTHYFLVTKYSPFTITKDPYMDFDSIQRTRYKNIESFLKKQEKDNKKSFKSIIDALADNDRLHKENERLTKENERLLKMIDKL